MADFKFWTLVAILNLDTSGRFWILDTSERLWILDIYGPFWILTLTTDLKCWTLVSFRVLNYSNSKCLAKEISKSSTC